ncbi:MAG: hypothetical protein UR28_C0021G0026 [Candidatus Peregrinibacteria bacterium GW2011_GWF2_33_10]|nr:MAG: hypothetical protein UR28_C0021G0026 [Candidatus Peregrinibacteria bacterium GW2011_GWF2_33_10]OGJ44542.1 MAG: hypothetical protein A2263_00200 [Candidatus Peregrinibacteria bacterium RIFOXYA2_FULL_33_21]
MKLFQIKYLFLVLLVTLFNLNYAFASDINLNDFTVYKNILLNLKFEYPKIWGDIETSYIDTTSDEMYLSMYDSNYIYNIDFSKIDGLFISGQAEKPSKTIEEFYNKSIDEMCSNLDNEEDPIKYPNVSSCNFIQENILTFFSSLDYESYCLNLPIAGLIKKIVAIDLIDNPSMDVLTFYYSFLSPAMQKELTDVIDQTDGCHYPLDEGYDNAQQQFDLKVQEILDRINNGIADEETIQNLANFDYFANSFEDWKEFEKWPSWAQTYVTWALNNNILDSDESVLQKVDENSFKYTLALMLYRYDLNAGGTKYDGEVLTGDWPEWANIAVSWALDKKIFDSKETVSYKVSQTDFKYTLALMLYKYYLNTGKTKYDGEILTGNWPEWANTAVSWAINDRVIDSKESVLEPVDEDAFKYTLSAMMKRYDQWHY